MGSPIDLTSEEQKLKIKLERYLIDIKKSFNRDNETLSDNDLKELYAQMADTAHQLHISLKNKGIEPKHHKYMTKNRGCASTTKKFYEHIHPVEDLLAFIHDRDANNDPEDKTIGKKFEMHIFTRRWGHKDLYMITRTINGWDIEAMTFSGKCNKNCAPILYKALEHDGVCYPKQIGLFFEWLWIKAAEKGLTEEEVQKGINAIGAWINNCEENTPQGIFGGLI